MDSPCNEKSKNKRPSTRSTESLLSRKKSSTSSTGSLLSKKKFSTKSTGSLPRRKKSNTNSTGSLLRRKKCSKLKNLVFRSAFDESSSCSEDTEPFPRRWKKIVRALSDYESGDNDVGKAGSSSASSSRVNAEERVTKQPNTENVRCSTTIQFKDLCSSDSDEFSVRLTSRRGFVKPLSDYETEDSVYHAREALLNLSKGNQNVNNSTNSSQENDDSDSSYEGDTACNEFKRALNTFSTSDSFDSESSVKQRCFRKRRKIYISSEESDDENENVAHSHRRCRPYENDITRTDRGVDYQDTRQITRTLRPTFNNWRCASTESDSSSVDELSRFIREELDETRATLHFKHYNNQQNLLGGSSSGGQSSSNVHSATSERSMDMTQQNSSPPATLRQIIRRTPRLFRGINNQLFEQQRMSSWVTESQLSSNNMRVSNSGIRVNTERYVDSSDSDLQFEPRRLRGGTVQLIYSDSDSSIEQTPADSVISSGTANSDVSQNSLLRSVMQDENSSDSDTNPEKCPICFCGFGNKEVASPVSCDHSFCTQCIQEWAKIKNTCPIDRILFDKLVVHPNFSNDKVIRVIPIETPPVESVLIDGNIQFRLLDSRPIVLSSEEEEDRCVVCHSYSDSYNFIVCEMCDGFYHLSCLRPPLRYIPADSWCCPTCRFFDQDRNWIT